MAEKPQQPPTIELEGVRLRPLRMGDAAALYAYLREPVVTELTSYPVVSVPMVEAMIERSVSRWAAGDMSKWGVALQQDDQLVGTCGFNDWSQAHRWAELAFDLAPAHWGKGLMRQAVAAVLQWTFQQDQVHRVHAFVRVDNRRSERLLVRSGFAREGCLRGYRVCRGQPHDFYIYGLLRPDWAAAPPYRYRAHRNEEPMADHITIRPATLADLAEINAIYNYYIGHSTCVWTTQPCSESERKAWYEEHGQTMPVLVAEYKGRVVGWGALGSFRAAYTAAGTLEDSIYVHHDFHRRKIGSRLLAALIDAARRLGLRSILANISADQTPSIGLHEKFGFQQVARLRQVGAKFNQRFDAVYLQLLLAASVTAES